MKRRISIVLGGAMAFVLSAAPSAFADEVQDAVTFVLMACKR